MGYSDRFLDALGRWQRGWRQNPVLRGSIAENLLRELADLPDYVGHHDGTPVYRKRNLYRREDQRELVPLFFEGVLDEGAPTSWSTSIEFAESFGRVFDDHSPNSVSGAIFRHVPVAGEVILNIIRLWQDDAFVNAADSYRRRGGAEAGAIFHFRGDRDQYEVILRAPLRKDEIYRLGRSTTIDSLYEAMGAESGEAKAAVDALLQAANIDPGKAIYLTPEATAGIVDRVFEQGQARVSKWIAERRPARPCGRRGRLSDAFELGRSRAASHAKFLGWRRLRGRGGLMEARWSDGTVAYHGFFGRVWIW